MLNDVIIFLDIGSQFKQWSIKLNVKSVREHDYFVISMLWACMCGRDVTNIY